MVQTAITAICRDSLRLPSQVYTVIAHILASSPISVGMLAFYCLYILKRLDQNAHMFEYIRIRTCALLPEVRIHELYHVTRDAIGFGVRTWHRVSVYMYRSRLQPVLAALDKQVRSVIECETSRQPVAYDRSSGHH